MEMLLMGVCLSVFGFAVAALAFGAATRTPEEYAAEASADARAAQAKAKVAALPSRFFVDPAIPLAARNQVPIEALLLQIENHVRLEQAAAENFLHTPNASMLHSRTISTLVN